MIGQKYALMITMTSILNHTVISETLKIRILNIQLFLLFLKPGDE